MEKDFEKYKKQTDEIFPKYDFDWKKTINIYRNKEGKKCLNEFEKQKKIGEGSSWKVYLVKRYYYDEKKQIKTKLFALKKTHIMVQYKRRYYKDEKLSNYFEKILSEVEIMGILTKNENEYIINIYELIYDNEGENKTFNLYMVNDYCEIGTIMNRDTENYNHFHNPLFIKYFYPKLNIELDEFDENLIKKNSISLDIKHSLAKNIFKQLLLAVKYIHSFNIAHRDIKIENILFDSNDGKIKIIDFSISTIVKSENKLINEPGGSMHYQSPEFFNNDDNKGYYDPFIADIWAVGICLYIFIFEEFPFDADSELELGIKISDKPFKFPYNPENEDFELLINAMLDKNIKKRINNIDDLLKFKYFN
jgi:serine/threonine protein kinase